MASIGIIGYGKFGKVVEHVLQQHGDFKIAIYDPRYEIDNQKFLSLQGVIEKSEIIIVAVTLVKFEKTIQDIAQYVRSGQTVIEVCSVNVYPKQIMTEYLPAGVNMIGSHPMFGSQTLKHNDGSVQGFNIVIEDIRTDEVYAGVIDFLNHTGLNVIEISADNHDKRAAKFHFLAQLVGNTLVPMDLERTAIDTVSYEFLFNFMERLDPDPELLQMMYQYNPYAREYLERYGKSFEDIKGLLSG